jgi:DNA-binding phage protein
MPRSRAYHEFLLEALKDHEEAVAYLNAALDESTKGDKESKQILVNALGNIFEALA